MDAVSGFNGPSSGSLVDSGAESDVDCGAPEAERERTLAAGIEVILATVWQSVDAFYPCPKNLSGAKSWTKLCWKRGFEDGLVSTLSCVISDPSYAGQECKRASGAKECTAGAPGN